MYCVDGRITDNCTAGFICWKGNGDPMPWGNDSSATVFGEPCPYGYYCPAGENHKQSSKNAIICGRFINILL